MAIKKSKTETFRLKGPPSEGIDVCAKAMEHAGFQQIARNDEMGQLSGRLRSLGAYGEAQLTLTAEGDSTRVELTSTTNVDNIWAIGGPNKRLIQRLKAAITDVSAES